MSRPGVAKVLDPLVASLLAFGDETIPAVPPSLTHLHTVLRVMVEHAADVIPDSDSDSGIVSDPEECLAQEERLEQRVSMLKRKEGLSTDRTLKQAFKLMDCLIGQYKLNRTDEILEELQSVCEERGGDWKVKYIQSTGFVRWKQYRFREVPDVDGTHQPWALCDPNAHQPWAYAALLLTKLALCDHCLAGARALSRAAEDCRRVGGAV